MTIYDGSPSWLRYRDLLKVRFGIEIARDPTERWETLRGHRVHIDDWAPDGAEQGTVILVHGGGGHGRILAPLADAIAGMGWRALAPDLPGYGLTQPAPGFRWEYAEWPQTVAALADATPGPVVLFGLSVGGMTAVHAARIAARIDGVIATTLLDMTDPDVFVRAARWRWLGRLSRIGMKLAPALADGLALPLALAASMRAMSSDPALQDYFARDRLLGAKRVPARFFRTLGAYAGTDAPLRCPLLLVHPGADAWTPTDLSLSAYERIDAPKRFRELSNGSHLPAEQPAFDELRVEVAAFLASISGR